MNATQRVTSPEKSGPSIGERFEQIEKVLAEAIGTAFALRANLAGPVPEPTPQRSPASCLASRVIELHEDVTALNVILNQCLTAVGGVTQR